jgi:hypothetical protein
MHSLRIEPIDRSAYAFCQGEQEAVGRSRMPIDQTPADNDLAIGSISAPD